MYSEIYICLRIDTYYYDSTCIKLKYSIIYIIHTYILNQKNEYFHTIVSYYNT